jgi:hypothetical protein
MRDKLVNRMIFSPPIEAGASNERSLPLVPGFGSTKTLDVPSGIQAAVVRDGRRKISDVGRGLRKGSLTVEW